MPRACLQVNERRKPEEQILVTAAARTALAERSDVQFERIGTTSLGPEENFRAVYA